MTDFIHIKMLLLFTSENKDLNCKIKEHKDFTLDSNLLLHQIY